MKNLLHSILFVSVLLSAGSLTARAGSKESQNWPQWRGPLASGVAPDADPPVVWSETSNVKWKANIPGGGSATPIIWDDRIFIQTAISTGKKPGGSANESPNPKPVPAGPPGGRSGRGRGMPGGEAPSELYQFSLICLDRQSGKVLWQKVCREEVPHEGVMAGEGSFAASSPVTDGRRVYAYFGSAGLHCYDLDGNLKWEKDFGKMRIKMSFGEGSSAALAGNAIVVVWDNEGGSFIAALNKENGNELWRTPREEATSWATPLMVQSGGKSEIVTDASRKIRSYDLATGVVLWECAGLTANVIPSPVADADKVYCMSGFRGNALLAIHLGRTGDLTGTDAIAWSHNKSTPYVPSPLLYGDKLYFLSGNNGMLSCFDTKSGKALIDAERLEDLRNVYASPVGAGDRVYITSRDGVTLVLKNSGKLDVLATNRLDEKFDASPAVAGREMFLRGQSSVYCLAVP